MPEEDDQTVASKIKDRRTKIQKTQAIHEQKSKERADAISNAKALYQAERENPLLADILAKAKNLSAMHLQLAQDGVGFRNTGALLENGMPEQEVYYFTPDKRCSELDRSAGNLEIVNYIERMMKVEVPAPNPELAAAQQEAEEKATEAK